MGEDYGSKKLDLRALSERGKSTNRLPDNGLLSQRGLVLSHVAG